MLIVLDGLDGSGKSTQFDIIKDRLSQNHKVRPVSFPDYSNPSSTLVKMYLNKEITCDAEGVNAWAASGFYASDRYISYKLYWEQAYLNGELILASRYVTSNAIHQMPKLDKIEWDNYLEWLCDYEYNKLGLPRPDKVVFLDMPVEISQNLLTGRYNGDESRKDIHESDLSYLSECRKAALYAAGKQGWNVVRCGGNEPYPIELITEKIMECIAENA